MLTLLSPAKTLDYSSPVPKTDLTKPMLLKDSAALADIMKTKSASELQSMMKISSTLAELNVERFQSWKKSHTPKASRQAIFAFKGDVYLGLDAHALTKRDLQYAQKSLRILSGLYGVLRPLDLIRPYRLEMGRSVKSDRGPSLYDYWRRAITVSLKDELSTHKQPTVINLASNEYFKAVDTRVLDAPIIQAIFKEKTPSGYKLISFYAKKARGLMAQYMIKNRIDQPEDLKTFDLEGYKFNKQLSTASSWTFIRSS